MKRSLIKRALLALVRGVDALVPDTQAWVRASTARAEVQALLALANAGDADAQAKLGVAYELGRGVPQDCTCSSDSLAGA